MYRYEAIRVFKSFTKMPILKNFLDEDFVIVLLTLVCNDKRVTCFENMWKILCINCFGVQRRLIEIF